MRELSVSETRRIVVFMIPFISIIAAVVIVGNDIVGIMIAIWMGVVLAFVANWILKKIFKE